MINNQTNMKSEIIDADIHPNVKGEMKALMPYMSRSWQKHFEIWKSLPVHPMRPQLPGGSADRADTVPPSGGPPASDPIYIKETHLDKHNIKYAVISSIQASKVAAIPNPNDASVIASAFNDLFLDQWHGVDSRFRLALHVSPHDPISAAKEIERLGDEKGVAAIFIPLNNILLGKSHYYPIYEAAIKYDLPIFLHPTGTEGGFSASFQFGGGFPSTYAERHTRFVEIGYANIPSLVFEGVFERYPELKMVFAEFGYSWLPNLLWRMDQNWRNFRKEVPWLKKEPSKYVLEHCRFTTQPLEEPTKSKYLTQIFEMINAEEVLLFSSDYPHWDYDDPETTLSSMSKEFRERIFYKNALEVYRFK